MRRIDVLLGKKLPYTLACKHYQSYVSITFCFVLDLIAMLEDVLAHETSFIESFEPIHHSALSSALKGIVRSKHNSSAVKVPVAKAIVAE